MAPAEAANPSPLQGDGDEAIHRLERGRRLRLSIGTSLLIKPLAVVISFVTVPLFLNYLGITRFGLYESVGALAAWLGLTNVGMGLGLINKLTDTHVSGDRELARRYLATMLIATFVIAVTGTLLLSIVVPLINWGAIFPTDDPLAARETPWAVWLAGLAVFVGSVTTIPHAVYVGYQEIHRSNVWDGIAKLSVLGGSILVVATPFGLVGAIAVVALLPALVWLISLINLFAREKPWLRPRLAFFDRTLLRNLLLESSCLLVLQLATLGIFQSDKLVIANILGPAEVSGFAVVGRLFLIVLGVVMLVLNPLWPAYGEAFRRGDIAWIRRTVSLTAALSCAAYLACGALMYFVGDFVLNLWTRGQPPPISKMLVLGMTATFVSRAWTQSQAVALNGAGVLRPQMIFLGANAVLNVITAIVLANRWGVDGVAWSIPISSVLTSAWGYPWMMRHYVYRRRAGIDAVVPVTSPVNSAERISE